jgi:hypothetical protein
VARAFRRTEDSPGHAPLGLGASLYRTSALRPKQCHLRHRLTVRQRKSSNLGLPSVSWEAIETPGRERPLLSSCGWDGWVLFHRATLGEKGPKKRERACGFAD